MMQDVRNAARSLYLNQKTGDYLRVDRAAINTWYALLILNKS